MREHLRALSPRAEFSIVITAAFGLFIFHSVRDSLQPGPSIHISEAGLRFLLVYEPLLLAALMAFLSARGWTSRDFGLSWPNVREAVVETLLGLGLALVVYMLYVAIWRLAAGLFTVQMTRAAIVHRSLITSGVSLTTAIAVSLVNPIFEEVFACGYVISATRRARWPVWAAIAISIGARLLYHLYQGAVGIIGIIPVGLAFAYWYARSNRLWSVIVAHAAFDIYALSRHIA